MLCKALLLNAYLDLNFFSNLQQGLQQTGTLPTSLPVTKDAKSGCSLSFILLVIAVKPLVDKSQKDKEIFGIKIQGEEY